MNASSDSVVRTIPRARDPRRPHREGLALLVILVLAGCARPFTVGPDYVPPELFIPDAWQQELTRGLAEGKADLQTWWTTLEDPVLDHLIRRARAGNLSLKEAAARVREARATLGIATGQWFPEVDGRGAYERNRLSEGVVSQVPPSRKRTDSSYSLGFDATWEIDLWGRISRSVESARADLTASVEDYRDALVVLLAEVASNYVDVRSLQLRIQYAAANADLQRAAVKLTRDRLDAGLVPELDVRQAESNLASTESRIPSLRIVLAAAINRLGVLIGEPPGALHDLLRDPAPTPRPPENILVALPADLLRQRPDVRRAERQLAAQTARIGVAAGELYPRFSLTGTFALEATRVDLFDSGNRAWGFGPSMRWNLFDGGRVRSAIRVEDERTEQALFRYEQAVLSALEDAENAMVSYVEASDRRDALGRAVGATRKSAELVETLYKTGLTDFQNVLDTQRSLAQREDELAESEGTVTLSLIRIYKALGGGWAQRKPGKAKTGGSDSAAPESPEAEEGQSEQEVEEVRSTETK